MSSTNTATSCSTRTCRGRRRRAEPRVRPGGSNRGGRTRPRSFPRVVSLILKDSFIVVQADIYNRRDEKQKVYTVRRLEQVEGIWTAMESEMTNAIEKSRTELLIEKMDYNAGVKETDFTRRELERGNDSR